MIKAEIDEFNLGKRHLANIMGQDPDLFEQEDIDVSISWSLTGPHSHHAVICVRKQCSYTEVVLQNLWWQARDSSASGWKSDCFLRVWLQKPEQSCCHGVLQRDWSFFGSWRAQFANFTVVQLCMAAFSICIINILGPSDLFIWTDKSVKTSEQCVCLCVCVCKLHKLLVFCVTCIFSNCSLSFKIYNIMNYMLLCTVMWLMFSHILISLMR